MTPTLQQAIKLLQMTRLGLQDVVNQEMEANPVLEEEDPEASPSADDDPSTAEARELDLAEATETSSPVQEVGAGEEQAASNAAAEAAADATAAQSLQPV